jgi:uncharacterized protein YbjT (DUF2867 family)
VRAWADYRFGAGDPQQTRNLLAACADIHHLVYVSIVGVEQIPLRYHAHKLECERLVSESGLPTRFFVRPSSTK